MTTMLKDVPRLFPAVFDDDRAMAREVVNAIGTAVKNLPPLQWSQLDIVSRSWRANGPATFRFLQPADLARLAQFPEAYTLLLGLASFHWNGYVRQAAVDRLAAISEGSELPFLLLRLNDWVSDVSSPAWVACKTRLRSDYAPHYVANLPLVLKLATPRRRDLTSFVNSVIALLHQPECRPALLAGMTVRHHTVRRACVRIALEDTVADASGLLEAALSSRDGFVRLMAARALRQRPAGDPTQKKFALRLVQDTLSVVRREALYLYHEKLPEIASAALQAALLDATAPLRETARYYLRLNEPVDFRAFYLDAMHTPEIPHLAAAIAGVGETGRVEDAQAVEMYLRHPSASMREAAVFAVGKLDGERYVEPLLAAINDTHSRVSRAASVALRDNITLASDGNILGILVLAKTSFCRRNTLRLISTLSKWRSGLLLLEAYVSANSDEARREIVGSLSTWLYSSNQSFIQPTPAQRQRWQELIETHSEKFTAVWLTDLRNAV